MGTLTAFILAVVIYSSLAILKSCLVVFKKPANLEYLDYIKEDFFGDMVLTSKDLFRTTKIFKDLEVICEKYNEHKDSKIVSYIELNEDANDLLDESLGYCMIEIKRAFNQNNTSKGRELTYILELRTVDILERYRELSYLFPANSKLISASTKEESSDNENSFTIENSLESNSKNLKSILLENRNNPEIKSLVETQLNQINSIIDSRKQEQEFEKLKEVKNKLNANKRYLDSVEQTNWD